jgi:hypothetical protein
VLGCFGASQVRPSSPWDQRVFGGADPTVDVKQIDSVGVAADGAVAGAG